jgi:hypothetical protein
VVKKTCAQFKQNEIDKEAVPSQKNKMWDREKMRRTIFMCVYNQESIPISPFPSLNRKKKKKKKKKKQKKI